MSPDEDWLDWSIVATACEKFCGRVWVASGFGGVGVGKICGRAAGDCGAGIMTAMPLSYFKPRSAAGGGGARS